MDFIYCNDCRIECTEDNPPFYTEEGYVCYECYEKYLALNMVESDILEVSYE